MHALLPEPVVPAISKCGRPVKSENNNCPSIVFPSATALFLCIYSILQFLKPHKMLPKVTFYLELLLEQHFPQE